jgi:S-adenosylmethionine uptake transporter
MTNALNRPGLGILFICLGVVAISINDMLIKLLSGGYPLHQMVFARSAIGLIFTIGLLMYEGGPRLLRTSMPGFHALRGLLVVLANMTFYAAVAVLPLGQATALFFVAPLFITVLSIPLLGEQVGAWRIGAVLVGFAGMLIMQQPWKADLDASRLVLLLPVIAAGMYALMQVLTRKLGATMRASAMAFYIEGTFLIVSAWFFLIAGVGRFAEGVTNASLIFLLRAWVWPTSEDWPVFIGLGLCSGIVGYCLRAAYRMADAATIAPFEYVGLPLAILWGWSFFDEWPSIATWAGCALIIGAGLTVFIREQIRNRPQPGRRARWGRR